MALSAHTQQQLQTLMQQDLALVAKVHGTDDAAQAAALIAQAAAHNGIQITEAELASHFVASAKESVSQALSDEQLDAVAGGGRNVVDTVFMSIFTLGIGCAVISIQTSIESSKNGKLGACSLA